ncbi:hypothetical protein HF867_03125 [Lactobacillus salivarius]|uniref:hypothetical protein n=1 Tax=Ligilactobacillus salivarius TaxID=1624 RepID=UPI001472AB09|nr:hypothetical protein [Ligilactobacillus salivarius]NME23894.1 hypothetical protein [Ligilactobacillus salivarius]
MDRDVLYLQLNQSLITAFKQLAVITEAIKETNLDSLTQYRRIIKESLPTYSTLQHNQLNNLNYSIKQMYHYFESMSEILKLQSDISKKLTLSSKIYFEHLQKIPKIQINIPKTTIHNFSDYYKSDFRIPLMLEDIINKSLQNPDKVNDLLSKNIDKALYNKNINSSDFVKKSRIKNTDNTKNVINYSIDTVNITYQAPISKESNNRFDESPDSNRDKSPSNKPTDYLQVLFTFLIFLFNNIAQLPDAVEGSKMIYNVLKNILQYLQ